MLRIKMDYPALSVAIKNNMETVEYHIAIRQEDAWWTCQETKSFEEAVSILKELKSANSKVDHQILKKTVTFEVVYYDSAQLDLL